MYARNNASPRPITIAAVVQISDGAVQTTGVSVKVRKDAGAWATGAGTLAVEEGMWSYTPTQSETDCDALQILIFKTGCIPQGIVVVTTSSSSFGHAGTDQSKIANASATQNLSGTTIKTATDVEVDTQDIQNRLPSGLVDGRMRSIAEVVGDKTNYKLASDGLSLVTSWTVNITGNITGNLSGSVGSVTGSVGGNVTGSVGSISGITFPASFGSWTAPLTTSGTASAVWDALIASYTVAGSFGSRVMRTDNASAGNGAKVTGAGHVAADIHELQPAVINNTHFASGAFDANALAADAVTEIQDGLALEASSQSILARIGAFTGTGVNTILGFFRALLRSDGGITTPSDVGGTFTHTTDSTQAIRDRGDAAWTTGGGGGGSTTVNVLPYTGAVPDRVEGTTIKVFYNELTDVSVGVTDASGTAVTIDAKVLEFIVEDRYGADVLVIPDGSITKSGSTFTITIPQSLTDVVDANYRWALRDLTGSKNTVLMHGQIIVSDAAEDDA